MTLPKYQVLPDVNILNAYISSLMIEGNYRKANNVLFFEMEKMNIERVFIHEDGFARFTAARYNNDVTDLDNMYVHLTNVAIQKNGDDYNEKHGNKWILKNLRLYTNFRAIPLFRFEF